MRNLSPASLLGNVQERLDYFRDAVHGAAKSNFGKKKNKSADWFEAHTETITPAIEEKRNVLTG